MLFVSRKPAYNPNIWNKSDIIRDWNNCYNYACDILTNTFAQPGRASGIILNPKKVECKDFIKAAQKDGLILIQHGEDCVNGHKVALAIDPDDKKQFHWFRQDDNGMWSHKPGHGYAVNYDWSNKPIKDPSLANRGRYKIFCGFFCVDKNIVKIR